MTKVVGGKSLQCGAEKLGSGKFFEIGPIAACMTDYPERIAPKSPHQYRLESVYELQVAYN